MSFSRGIDKKPGRWLVLTIFVGLFLIIFIQNGGLFIDSPETFVMISGDNAHPPPQKGKRATN